ncbi:hypothetical protein EUTSA_v10002275mg [Eutrema salsugineum]|uniref:TTF-type domain-containing protein n=1 Tax=Eutrema salsugineum TaxID=72664 RepID=V4LHX0_EUTSA|nr:hypothetical protein EUTSA_v10002275mg [Eutrema salsugineum]
MGAGADPHGGEWGPRPSTDLRKKFFLKGKRSFKRKGPEDDSKNLSGDLENFPSDPADRKRILEYHANERDEVRRKYLMKGPCQPRGHKFPPKMIGNKLRRFNSSWFDQYGDWLEYNVKKDKAFCLLCYLFRDFTENKAGSDAFLTKGFDSWNKTERLHNHVGAVNSFHNSALKRADNLMKKGQSICHAFYKQEDAAKNEYKIRLNASIDTSRYLLRQGLPFRGHDESVDSTNKGNFLELVKYTAEQNELVMVSHEIQTEIVHYFAEEIIESVIQEIDHGVFCLLVDESADVSDKEQMAVVFRFVDKHGIVKESFIGLVHVKETSSLSLKIMNMLRGQGYEASNMKGEFKGLRALILKENKSAYYVHCFAHQLQLVVIAIAKKKLEVGNFFDMIAVLLNVVGASCKRKDMVREDHRKRIEEKTKKTEIKTGKGLNQELSFQRPGKTRWGSHYKTLLRLVDLFPSVIQVLEYVESDGSDSTKRCQANGLLKYFHTFDFVFYLQLMLLLLGLTNTLSKALQRKDLDILNAMSLVKSTKQQLYKLRNNGWESFINKVYSFCENYKTELLVMEDEFIDSRKPRTKSNKTIMHHYKVECFYIVLDMQIQEFNDHFDEVNTELLGCIESLSPKDSFHEFDQLKIMRLSEFYPEAFSYVKRVSLEHQLRIYIDNIREDKRFSNLKNLGDLARVMVETKKHLSHPLVYRLLKLVLTLPVATAIVERCFSEIVKTVLRNRMSDQFLNDCVVCFVEKELLEKVTNEVVMKKFQNMKPRKIIL